MDPRDYLRRLARSWLFLVVGILVGVAAASAAAFVQHPTYSATSKVYISTAQSASIADLTEGNTFTQSIVKSYATVATTPIVLDPVVRDLRLRESAGALAKQISVTNPTGTVILEVAVDDRSPTQAANIANAVASTLADVVVDLNPASSNAGASVKVSTVQAAQAPSSPSAPQAWLYLLLGGIVGLLIGAAAAAVREALDTRLRSERDLRQLIDVPVLGEIGFDSSLPTHPLVLSDTPHSPRSEEYRNLRTSLQYVNGGKGAETIVVTSTVSGEGKTTTCANLGIAFADAGKSVLLVDSDLRRPRLASYFGVIGAIGLTDVLVGNVDFEDVVQSWRDGAVDVLTAGSTPPNPSELLQSDKMIELMAEWAASYDVVIYDAPPMLPVSDAAILSRSVTGALVVVSARKSRRQHLRGALETLGTVGSPVLGFVLTMTKTSLLDRRYYNYNYGYASVGVDESAAPEGNVTNPGSPDVSKADEALQASDGVFR